MAGPGVLRGEIRLPNYHICRRVIAGRDGVPNQYAVVVVVDDYQPRAVTPKSLRPVKAGRARSSPLLVKSGWPTTTSASAPFVVGMLFQIMTRLLFRSETKSLSFATNNPSSGPLNPDCLVAESFDAKSGWPTTTFAAAFCLGRQLVPDEHAVIVAIVQQQLIAYDDDLRLDKPRAFLLTPAFDFVKLDCPRTTWLMRRSLWESP